jgi:hypothetical protein
VADAYLGLVGTDLFSASLFHLQNWAHAGLAQWPYCSLKFQAYPAQSPYVRGCQTPYSPDLYCTYDAVWHGGVVFAFRVIIGTE